MVGVGMGLLRQDGEVESAVAEDDAVLVLASVAAHAMLKRMSRHHRVPRATIPRCICTLLTGRGNTPLTLVYQMALT